MTDWLAGEEGFEPSNPERGGRRPDTSLQKRLDFRGKQSVTADMLMRAAGPSWIPPRWRYRHCGASVVTAREAVATERIL